MARYRQYFINAALIIALSLGIYFNLIVFTDNAKLSKQIKGISAQVEHQKLINRRQELLISYYQSPEYQEVEARRRLLLKMSNEKAIRIHGLPQIDGNVIEYDKDPVKIKSNPELWLDYFTNRDL